MPADELIEGALSNPRLAGITFSGGEPFAQAAVCAYIARGVAAKLNVITYTGYTYEELVENADSENGWMELLETTDILIDGPFSEREKTMMLRFRGSANQRVIDCKGSIREKTVMPKLLDF